jgi:hypothetical protein
MSEEKKEDPQSEEPEEEDVTDRLTALEGSVDEIKALVRGIADIPKGDETPPAPSPEERKPESPPIKVESPFDTIFVRKRGGRVVKRQIPKKKEEAAK